MTREDEGEKFVRKPVWVIGTGSEEERSNFRLLSDHITQQRHHVSWLVFTRRFAGEMREQLDVRVGGGEQESSGDFLDGVVGMGLEKLGENYHEL